MTEALNNLILKFVMYAVILFPILFLIRMLLRKNNLLKDSKDKVSSGIKGSGLIKSEAQTGFIFGKQKKSYICMKSNCEGHVAIFGPSGEGKTTALLIPSLRSWDGTFFSIDISGDISRNVKNADNNRIILSPDDVEESVLYNVFYLIDKTKDYHDKKEKLEQLVNLIISIPDNANETTDYFLKTARKIFLASMLAFYNIGMDFTDICKTVFFNDVVSLAELIEETNNELALGYILPLASENEKNIAGAKSSLNEKIKIFADNINMQSILRRPITDFDGNTEECFYPEALEDTNVFLKVPDKKQEFYAPFMHIVTGQVLEYISGREFDKNEDKRILLALDEFVSIGHFEILGPFRKFRKNGANIVILTQSIADIDLIYSEKERQVILDNCKYVVVLGGRDNNTRDYFSNLVGKQEKKNTSVTVGRGGESRSISTQRDYVINPEEWKSFGDKLAVIHPSGYVMLEKNFYYKN